MPGVHRNVPVAALDHLRVGERILPLPQPVSLSVAETLRDLVETTQDVKRVQQIKPSDVRAVALPSKIAPWRNGLLLTFSWAVSEGHRLGERQEDVDPVRGRQGLAKSQQDVWDVSIRFAACRSGVQKGQTLPLRV